MIKRKDTRSARSKYFIRKAMAELLDKSTLEELSVAEISQKAEVSRRTFYIYFESKKDCLVYIMQELLEEMFGRQFFEYIPDVDAKNNRDELWMSRLENLIQIIHDNRVLVQAMFRDLTPEEWLSLLRAPYDEQMNDFWEQTKASEEISDSIADLCKTIDCMQLAMYMNYIATSGISGKDGFENMAHMLQLQKKRRIEWETALFGGTVSLSDFLS